MRNRRATGPRGLCTSHRWPKHQANILYRARMPRSAPEACLAGETRQTRPQQALRNSRGLCRHLRAYTRHAPAACSATHAIVPACYARRRPRGGHHSGDATCGDASAAFINVGVNPSCSCTRTGVMRAARTHACGRPIDSRASSLQLQGTGSVMAVPFYPEERRRRRSRLPDDLDACPPPPRI